MPRNHRFDHVVVAVACLTLASTAALRAQHQHAAPADKGKTMTDEQTIASAMKAAPAAVSKDATIIAMGEDGKVRVVRQGTNNFTCMGDNPGTPGPDPMCGDPNAMEFINAWLSHSAPPADKVGFMYMLEGGTDASNTDPYATAPTPGNHWVKTGAHVMVVGAGSTFLQNYPASPDPDTTKPYVMWAGTPYAHLMIPVR